MKARLTNTRILIAILVISTLVTGLIVSVLVFATGDSRLTVKGYSDIVRFEAAGVETLQVQIYDLSGKEVWDSGMVAGNTVDWDRRNESGERMAYGAYLYVAQGWEAGGELSFKKNGKLALMPGDKVQLQQAPAVSSPRTNDSLAPFADEGLTVQPKGLGDTGIFGQVGIGTESPSEELEVSGDAKIYHHDATPLTAIQNPVLNLHILGSSGAANELPTTLLISREGRLQFAAEDSGGAGALFAFSMAPATGDNKHWIMQHRGPAYSNRWELGYMTSSSNGWDPISASAKLAVTTDGKVGIGTTNTTAKLTIEGTSGDLIAAYNSSERVFAVKNSGEVRADGTVYAAGFSTGSADVAERINVSEWVEAGNVVEIDPEHPGFFRKSASPYSTKVAGIISTSPGVILGNSFDDATDEWEDNRPVLAVTGRVPCKVSTENGSIAIGDLLVASSTPGVAMKGNAEQAIGAVVGKAMEPLQQGEGTIIAQVMLR